MGKAPKKSRNKKSRKKAEAKNDSLPEGSEVADVRSGKAEPGDEPSLRSLSPTIEADFIIGDYLNELIGGNHRKATTDTKSETPSLAAEQNIEPFELEDITDSVIDSFLKNYSFNLNHDFESLAEMDLEAPPAALQDRSSIKFPVPPAAETEMEAEMTAPGTIAEKVDASASIPEIPLSQMEDRLGVILNEEIFTEEPVDVVSDEEKIIGEAPTVPPVRDEIQTDEPPATSLIPYPEVAEPPRLSEPDADEATVDAILGLQDRPEVTSEFAPPPPVAEPTPPASREEDPKILNEIHRCLLNGIQSYRAGEYEDAIIEFKKVLKFDPNHQAAYKMLGNAYFRNRMLSDALAAYEQYKKKYPVDAIVHENLGIIYARLGVFQLAIKEWQSLLDLQPERTDIVRKLEKAKTYLDQAPPVSKAPRDDKILLLNSGVEHYKSKNYGAAIQDFTRAVQQYPDAKEGYGFLGNAYFRNNQLREAAAAYEKAKQLDSTDLTAYENMGVIYARLGVYELALKEWEKVLELNPNRKDIAERLKKVLKKMQTPTV